MSIITTSNIEVLLLAFFLCFFKAFIMTGKLGERAGERHAGSKIALLHYESPVQPGELKWHSVLV